MPKTPRSPPKHVARPSGGAFGRTGEVADDDEGEIPDVAHDEALLDEALKETFPASDPISPSATHNDPAPAPTSPPSPPSKDPIPFPTDRNDEEKGRRGVKASLASQTSCGRVVQARRQPR